jgi:hypothetical protein
LYEYEVDVDSMMCFHSQVLCSSSEVLLNLDRSFKIELAWLQDGAYKALGVAIKEEILKCFPSKDKAVTLSQTEAKLGSLQDTKMYTVASRESQSAVDSIKAVVHKMGKGWAPAESIKTAGGVFTQVWEKLPFFVRHPVTMKEEVTGEQALLRKLELLKRELAKQERPAQLHELDQFKALACVHAVRPKSIK